MKTNKDKLVKVALRGEIRHPVFGSYKVSHEGNPVILPGTGGITYNHRVGDSCMDLVGDHVEPGVSIYHPSKRESDALMYLSCVGNEAVVTTGDAKGARGWVTGSHGGIENVILDFTLEDMEKMDIGDRIQIRSFGQGLELTDYPDIKVMNIDPDLLGKIGIEEKNSILEVPVAAKIPAYLMGSGIGTASAATGDYDIMTADPAANEKFGIDNLKFGDIILLEDCDNTYGRGYLKGARSLGVVVHSDCVKMGHGPGVMVILSSKKSMIEGRLSSEANIANYRQV